MQECQYILPWVGKCKKTVVVDMRCQDHAGVMCTGCGNLATGGCGYCMQFVCGFPICDNCEHAGGFYGIQHAPKRPSK